uniref:Uncharacterized protein n=1 Tax=Parascaris equorum TaxID=6256 RepID=A0A914RLM9_PAREQ
MPRIDGWSCAVYPENVIVATEEKGELALCEISNYLFCGAKVVGASATCLKFLEDNQERYAFH